MKARPTLYLVIVLTLVISSVIAMSSPVYAAELVTVDVATVRNTGTAGGARLGINTDFWWDDQGNRTSGARTLPAALSDMGVRYWRYPGGEKGDGMLWSTPPYTSPNPRLARISSQDWPSNDTLYWTPAGNTSGTWAHPVYDFNEFMADCNAANCEPVIVVAYDGIYKAANPGGDSLTWQEAIDAAAAWVNYANNVKGYDIKYWEIGNETWLPGYMGADPGRTQQGQDFIQFCNAMKAQDSTIWCGISADNQADWNTLLSIAAPQIDFMSVHTYEAYPYVNYSSYVAANLYPNVKVDYAWNALQNYPTHANRIKIMVTETAGVTFGFAGTWQNGDLGHALMTFDMLAQLQQDNRVVFTQFWNTHWIKQNQEGNVWPSTQSEYDALKPDNSFAPQGMAINLLSDYSLDRMVGTTSTSSVRTFASHDPAAGTLNIWLINKSTTSKSTTITLQNYTAPSSGTISALKGTGSTDMYPTFSQIGSTAVSNNQIAITLNPVSITLIELVGGGSGATPTPSPTPTSVVSNLVINPGFETGNISPWWSWNAAVVNSNAYSGSYAAQLTNNSGDIEQTISGLSPNTTYTATAWVRSSISGHMVRFGVKNHGNPESNAAYSGTSYSQVTLNFTTGGSSTSATIYCWRESTLSGFSYCDDLSIVPSGSSPTATPTIAPTAGPTNTPTLTPTPLPSGTNLALNKSTTTSSTQGTSYVGAKAVDASTSTRWWAQKGSTLSDEWITVDLGSNQTVGRVVVNQGDRWATTYSVQVSTDNTNWTTVGSTAAGIQGVRTFTFTATTARYVRMLSTVWSLNSDRIKLLEIEVYQN